MNTKTIAALALTAAFGLSAAQATPITLFNTGVGTTGTVLADGTVGDPHYTLTSVPSGTTDVRVMSSAGGWPIAAGVWLEDNALSRWIRPNTANISDSPSGNYVYTTTFDMTGLDLDAAHIEGKWATDNSGVEIRLNGVVVGSYTTLADQFRVGFAEFSITDGFIAGLNTLDFVVNNIDGPTGLRVEMTGSDVPEPGTLALAGLALLGLGMGKRRAAR